MRRRPGLPDPSRPAAQPLRPAAPHRPSPCAQVHLAQPTKLHPPKMEQFKQLVGWERRSTDHLPLVFLICETFRYAMAVMMAPAFPFAVLGTVVRCCWRRPAAAPHCARRCPQQSA